MNVSPATEKYLREIRIPIRLGCVTESGWPMTVPLWYLYEDGKLYCATQESSKVVAYLRHEPRCAFEVSADEPPYCGVRGQAVATIDEKSGAEVLERLLRRYLGGTNNQLAETLLAKRESEVAIVLEPANMFTWDFTDRMQDVLVEPSAEKLCPT